MPTTPAPKEPRKKVKVYKPIKPKTVTPKKRKDPDLHPKKL